MTMHHLIRPIVLSWRRRDHRAVFCQAPQRIDLKPKPGVLAKVVIDYECPADAGPPPASQFTGDAGEPTSSRPGCLDSTKGSRRTCQSRSGTG